MLVGGPIFRPELVNGATGGYTHRITPSLSGPPRERHLVVAVWVVATLFVAAGLTLVSVEIDHALGSIGPANQSTGGPRGPSRSNTPPAGSSLPLAVPGGPPQLSSLAPSTGAAGQTVVVTGANLMSPSGQVLARFGGVAVPTSCSSTSLCTVTVPPRPSGSSSVPVTVTTDAGTSNPVPFTYG